jgi:rhodanese-related sulfurtransferase
MISGKKFLFLFLLAGLLLSYGVAKAQEAGTIQPVKEEIQLISVNELKTAIAKNETVIILDVRGRDFDTSPTKIKGAIRVTPGELEAHLKDLPNDKVIVTYCACPTDGGSIKAAMELQARGYKKARVLKGGWNAWNQSGGQVEPR